jgi:hypothetical protein
MLWGSSAETVEERSAMFSEENILGKFFHRFF